MTTLSPAEVFPPSEYLRDELEARGWTEVEFAQILDRPVQLVSEILNDKKEITPETALELGQALGTSAELWLNLQSAYRLGQARSAMDLSPVERRARLRHLVPVRELRNRGWIENTDDLDDLEASVCSFLGMRTLDEEPFQAVAARRTNHDEVLSPEQTAWIARVRNKASNRSVSRYDPTASEQLAREIPRRLSDPVELRHLDSWLSDVGIAFVVELPLRSSKIDGASFWIGETPVVALSTRGNRFDGFVFTLLHEMAHLVRGHVTTDHVRVDVDLSHSETVEGIEAEASGIAAEWIFPDGLEVPDNLNLSAILDMADRYEVHPSLVIGRLQWNQTLTWNQHRKHIPRVRGLLGTDKEHE